MQACLRAWRPSLAIRAEFLGHRCTSSAAAAQRVLEVAPEQAVPPSKPLFKSLKNELHPTLLQALVEKPFGYSEMSSVQDAVLSHLPALTSSTSESPKDLLVKAKTGSGKTLAFLLPAVQGHLMHLKKDDQKRGPRRTSKVGVLVLSPTRELATQIAEEAKKLLTHTRGTDVHLFVGGASKGYQLRNWGRGDRDVVVATPGRMLDLLENEPGVADAFDECRTLILDEADTLLDMGFKDELERITDFLPKPASRQTFLFSATVSPGIRKIAQANLKPGHQFIDCVGHDQVNVHEHVPQFVSALSDAKLLVPHVLRLIAQDMIAHPHGGKAIVFLSTTRLTEVFTEILIAMKPYLPWGQRKTEIIEIHSRKSQGQRDRAAEKFRSGKGGYQILVSSDVSARGVDYPNVTRVIQVGIPRDQDTYIHRVGRTGRAGRDGRGDLVLLDFESDFPRNEMRKIPLRKLDLKEFDKELEELAINEDQNPTKALPAERPAAPARRSNDRRGRYGSNDHRAMLPQGLPFPADIEGRLRELPTAVEEVAFSTIDKALINDAFMSMLGFYAPQSTALGVSKSEMIKGLQQYAAEGLGLGEEPYVSPSLLAKMGLRGGRDGSRSNSRGGFRGQSDRGSYRPFGDRDGGRSDDRSSRGGSRDGRYTNDRRSTGNRWEGRGSSSSSSGRSYGRFGDVLRESRGADRRGR